MYGSFRAWVDWAVTTSVPNLLEAETLRTEMIYPKWRECQVKNETRFAVYTSNCGHISPRTRRTVDILNNGHIGQWPHRTMDISESGLV